MERRSTALIVVAVLGLAMTSIGCQQTGPSETADTSGGEFQTDTGAVETVVTEELAELKTIYFDFDDATIRGDQRGNLKSDADAILARADLGVVTLQGNTDERGSEEYNLALGERRAVAAKKYLVDLGVPTSRMRTVSFGEAKSAVAGHDESASVLRFPRWSARIVASSKSK
jgi:peptidoglycan-associated lipoprotein